MDSLDSMAQVYLMAQKNMEEQEPLNKKTGELDLDKIAKSLSKTIRATVASLDTLNIMVIGKTGVGKSTLINAVFRDNLAITGIGKPVTSKLRKYEKPGVPLAIYDTPGLELNEETRAAVKEEVWKTINAGNATGDINRMIHCIWYCINTKSHRVEPEETQWIRELTNQEKIYSVPVIIVLTQADWPEEPEALEMKKTLEDENLNVKQIIIVRAKKREIPGYRPLESFGLDTLIQITGVCLPDGLQTTLQNVQIADLGEKVRHAKKVVYILSSAAATAAAVPVPFSELLAFVPIQLTMLSAITVVFGYNIRDNMLRSYLTATIGLGASTIFGKLAAASLVKLIPGAGSAAGGLLNAAAAGLLTTALGETYIVIMEKVFNKELTLDDLATKDGKDLMKRLFQEEMAKNRQSG